VLELNLIPGQLSLAQLRDIYQQPVTLSLDASASAQIDASVACVEQILAENRTTYGINTGFGLLASTKSPVKTWKTSSVRWCCPTPPVSANRSAMTWCA
jgi:Histidine ammonia-lyase